jgi:hypothetical protein
MKCPTCDSDNTQRLSIIYGGGLTAVDTSTVGVGAGISGGGLGGGIGVAGTRGTHQTALSRQVAPPKRISMFNVSILPAIGFFVGLGILDGAVLFGLIWMALVLAGTAWVWTGTWRYNTQVWPQKIEKWNRQFMCMRCGEVFSLPK